MKLSLTKPIRLDGRRTFPINGRESELSSSENLLSIKEYRETVKKYFLDTFELEENLYSLLKSKESFYQRPNPLRHPLIFYYGHTATFFINKLYAGMYIKERIHPELESLLAIGVDEMSWDDLSEEQMEWPSVSTIKEYRYEAQKKILQYIDDVEFSLPVNWESPLWPILMGIEHQRIHIETSSVLIRELKLKFVNEVSSWPMCLNSGKDPQNQLLKVEGGEVQAGKGEESVFYGWDNEYGRHEKTLKPFQASQFLVSNGEYLEFVKAGGYKNVEWWSKEGWEWKQFTQAESPHFWRVKENNNHHNNSEIFLRLVDREIPLPMNWPVEVNQLEAHAFCQWKSQKIEKTLRLPTEDEYFLLYQQENVEHTETWKKAPGNINLEHFASPCPVNTFKFKNFYDVIGNVWQWTETPIYPFEGFRVHPLYDDFTVPTFDNKHNLIKGGSWISTGNESLPESRYAFRRHFFQHAGFRYVHSDNNIDVKNNPYETDTLLSQYCEFHYGDEYFDVPNFPKACIDFCTKYFSHLPAQKRALDLGCAVGRSTFELSRYFEHVTGLDFSARFIEKAQSFLTEKILRYSLTAEGDLVDFYERNLADVFSESEFLDKKNKSSQTASRIDFFQGDACNLSKKFQNFDFIFCGNLIDRLYSPKTFLRTIHQHLNPGGLLVLTSPYTWLEEYTPKAEWVGGYKRHGETVKTLQGLDEELGPWFDRIDDPHLIPFIIRETQRKFQHSLSEVTVWKKR